MGSTTLVATKGGRRRFTFAAFAFMLAILMVGPTALAVHDEGVFELDGNAVASGDPGDDWSTFPAGGAIATAFITDGTDPADTTYLHTGGSKDVEDFDQWVRTTTDEAPDKDEILHAFAAAYSSGGDLILYFGMDRFDASGDAAVGFWFTKDSIAINGTNVTGQHQDGDILILSDFVNGGSVPVVRVFEWVGSGGSDGPIDEITPSGDADCAAADPSDARCAIVNADTETAPWSFTNKSGDHDFAPGEFYEGGVNLTALGVTDGCFSTFIAETRTSQSTDARLKDVAMGGFPLCGIQVDKTGDALSKIGDTTHFTITVTNTGAVTLYRESIVDDVLGNLTNGQDANIDSSTCGASLGAGSSCVIHLSYVVQQGDPDPLVNTVDVVYDTKANLSGTELTDTDKHTTNLFQPKVEVIKGGGTTSKVGDNVHYTFQINNLSSSDAPDLVMDSIEDSLLGDLTDEAPAACDEIAAGDSCSFGADRVVQADDPNPLPNTVTVHYHPEGFPNDITDTDDHSVELFGPSVTIDKSGDTLGKIGDPAHYSFTITNTSTENAPDLILATITDDVIGDLKALALDADCGTLAPGASCSFGVDRTVVAGDPDPLVNRVDVLYHPEGFPNDITAFDTHSLNLFQPSVTVTKEGPANVTVGQPLTYTFTITNTSSNDSPPLNLESVTDVGDGWAGLGDLTDEAKAGGCTSLDPGESCSFQVTITAPANPDPLSNTVSVLYHPDGFPNDITANATHATRLVQVLPRKLARTGSDLGVIVALAIALILAGAGTRYLALTPDEP